MVGRLVRMTAPHRPSHADAVAAAHRRGGMTASERAMLATLARAVAETRAVVEAFVGVGLQPETTWRSRTAELTNIIRILENP